MSEFGDYELIARVGRGGVAEVWRARPLSGGTEVALKILSVWADSPGARRIAEEWRVMSRLRDPHIVEATALVEHDGRIALCMELCRGSLADVVRTRGPLPPRTLCDVGVQVCRALSTAHAMGIAHRDVKPANLLVDAADVVKLGDFGIAAALDESARGTGTESSAVWGTLPFLAPERRHGARGDARADIYSLAMSLVWLGCGRLIGDVYVPAVAETLRRELPEPLADALARAGAYAPEDRFGSTAELGAALEAARQECPQVDFELRPELPDSDTWVPTAPDARAAPSASSRWPVVVASISAILAAGSAVAVAVSIGRQAPTPSPAEAQSDEGRIGEPMPTERSTVAALPECADAVSRRQVVSRLGPRETVGALAADLDRDGWPEAIFTNQLDESLTVYWGGPDRLLVDPQRVAVGRSNSAASAADLDGDGDLDLVVNHLDDARVSFHRLDADHSFTEVASLSQAPAAHRVEVLDWDGDGTFDLLMQLEAGAGCTALRSGAATAFDFEPHVCIGPTSGLRRWADPAGTALWRLRDDGQLLRHERANGGLMDRGRSVAGPELGVRLDGDVIVAEADGEQGVEAYAFAKAPTGATLLRLQPTGAACRIEPEEPLGPMPFFAIADYDHDGTLDLVSYATCSGCESNHLLALGRPK